MLLVRDNCRLYNPPGSVVRRDCDEVFAYYMSEYERILEKWQKVMLVKLWSHITHQMLILLVVYKYQDYFYYIVFTRHTSHHPHPRNWSLKVEVRRCEPCLQELNLCAKYPQLLINELKTYTARCFLFKNVTVIKNLLFDFFICMNMNSSTFNVLCCNMWKYWSLPIFFQNIEVDVKNISLKVKCNIFFISDFYETCLLNAYIVNVRIWIMFYD
jgi:hypothetical protein